MSLSFCLHKWGGYIRKCTPALGFFFFWLLVLWLVLVDLSRKPQTLCLSYLSASQGVGLSPYRKVIFICSSVHAQGYLGHPELACFSCLWVSWVACLPVSIWPSTRKARTATLSELSSACGINCNLGEPTKFIQCSQRRSQFWCPWVGLKEAAWSQRSVWQPLGCDGLQPSLKLPIWWCDKAGKYLFPGLEVPPNLQRSPLVVIKWISNSPWIGHGLHKPSHFFNFLAWAFCA